MKKMQQMTQLAMGSPEDSGNTAYKPVINATTIAPMANMVRRVPHNKQFPMISCFLWYTIKKETNTEDIESTMAMVSVTTNALKAAFFARTAVPGLLSLSSL